MRARITAGPAVLLVLEVAVFTVLWALFSMIGDHTGWWHALLEGAVVAPFLALPTWFALRREREVVTFIVGSVTAEQEREVWHAANTGRPPADPRLRSAAAAVLRNRLDQHDRYRTPTLVVLAVFLLGSVLIAVTNGGWWLLGTAAFTVVLVTAVRYPGRLRRRLTSLGAAGPA